MLSAKVTALADLVVAAGTAVAAVRFTVTGEKGSAQSQDLPVSGDLLGLEATFPISDADTYTITAQAIDQVGNLLGTAASTTAVIEVPVTITVQVPGEIVATVA